MKELIIRFAVSCTVGALLVSGLTLQKTWSADMLSEEAVTDDYVYILGRALIVRQEQSDLEEPGAAYNTAKIVTVEPVELINPNLDVISLEAWIAVDDVAPVFLDTPEIKGRYHTVQISDEWGVVHFIATRDADGRLPEGNNDYLIHFPKGERPDDVAGSFWSVTLLGHPDNRVVPNRLGRFLFDSYSGLKYKKDGSLGILISREPKTGIPESNWLPSPEDKPFSLIFRIYAPKSEVKRGEWVSPAIKQYPEVK